MSIAMRALRPAIAFVAALVLAGAADALALDVVGGGIDKALACDASACTSPPGGNASFALDGALAAATGSVSIEGNLLDLSLSVDDLQMVSVGGPDAGVVGITFLSGLTYEGVQLTGSVLGDTFFISPGQTVNVQGEFLLDAGGSYVPLPALEPSPLDAAAAVTGSCTIAGGSAGECGFTIGEIGFSVDLGAGETRALEHTFNIDVAAPEPASWTLLALASAGIGLLRRRR